MAARSRRRPWPWRWRWRRRRSPRRWPHRWPRDITGTARSVRPRAWPAPEMPFASFARSRGMPAGTSADEAERRGGGKGEPLPSTKPRDASVARGRCISSCWRGAERSSGTGRRGVVDALPLPMSPYTPPVYPLNVPNVSAPAPQCTILHSNEERALCDGIFFSNRQLSSMGKPACTVHYCFIKWFYGETFTE